MSESARSLDALLPELYGEMHRLAAGAMKNERPDHTLQPTALVHEAYLKLRQIAGLELDDRRRFYALAARTMRQVLVDHARARRTAKRGGGAPKVALGMHPAPSAPAYDILALDQALHHLAAVDRRQVEVIELRFLAGLSVEETAEALEVSATTIKRESSMARAWLFRELGRDDGDDQR